VLAVLAAAKTVAAAVVAGTSKNMNMNMIMIVIAMVEILAVVCGGWWQLAIFLGTNTI
jgi:hypothetical protein